MNISERFNTAFNTIRQHGIQVDLTEAHGAPNTSAEVVAIEGTHLDHSRPRTAKAIGLLVTKRVVEASKTSHTTDYINLFLDGTGVVQAVHGTHAFTIDQQATPRVPHITQSQEHNIPEQSQGIALESAVQTIEDLLQRRFS
ncbi:MAG TPA: hypothetical protein VLE73_02750 [Candidatus Saccharimonadales bacterium]|nr:hypothetical protein [Candidatus Saccharimonadales bacterium]